MDTCHKAKCLYNVTNFYIRQVMTGIQKKVGLLQPNEEKVLNVIHEYLPQYNALRLDYLKKRLSKKNLSKNKKELLEKKVASFKEITFPTVDCWFVSYGLLEAVLKLSNNADYYNLPAQTNQQVMRTCYNDWKSYFKSLSKFKKDKSKFNSLPKIPNYKKKELTSVKFTNIICKIIADDNISYLTFPKSKIRLPLGNYISSDAKLQQVEIIPYYGYFKIFIKMKDKEFQPVVTEQKRVAGIDLGVNNIAAISNNVGVPTLLIKGDVIKSYNQWFNKRRVIICSSMQKGKHANYISKSLNALSRKRDAFLRDYFYKLSHSIIRYCKEYNIDTIIVGKNAGWKTGINLYHKENTQNFVSIPFSHLLNILQYLCLKFGIQYIETEESYTSLASILDDDALPNFKQREIEPKFSGIRSKKNKRFYFSKDGTTINADINGASNIIRKVVPSAFAKIDKSYLCNKPLIWDFSHYYLKRKSNK